MKLVMISHHSPSHKGGVEAVADALARAFAVMPRWPGWPATPVKG